MSKRGRSSGGSVTGGTGDIKPQQMTVQSTAGAVDDYGLQQVLLPVPRFGTTRRKSTIFEILKVQYIWAADVGISATAQTYFAFLTTGTSRLSGDTSTLATFNDDLGNSRTFAAASYVKDVETSGGYSQKFPIEVDMTDGNGNGFLIATDNFFLVQGAVGNAAAAVVTAKILYRIVNVGLEEYVGIVQSQTSVSVN